MKVTRDKTENSQAFLTIETEPAEVEDALKSSYRQLVKKVNIPGFRKGKAPREILESHVGRERLLDEALNSLIPEAYEKALEEQKIEAISRSDIEIVQTEPLIFRAIVPLRPKVELGDYQQIQVEPEPVEITDDNVNAVIEQLRHQHAAWEPVERPAELGDMVVLDIDSSVEGKPLINRKGLQLQLIPDQVFPAPGFSQQLVGMKLDEEREFELEYPSDYPSDELAGKKALFKVKVGEVKEENLPELNDEFAQAVGPELKTVDTLREEAASKLKQRAEERARADYEEHIVEAAVSLAVVEFPPVLAELEIDRMINQQLQSWQMDEKGLDEYLNNIGKTEEELRGELRPTAEKRVSQALVLGKVAEEKKIEVGDSEIDAEIDRMVESVEKKEDVVKALNTPQYREAMRQSLLTRKTIQRLVEIVEGKEKEESPGGADEG